MTDAEAKRSRLSWAIAVLGALQLGYEVLFIKLSHYELGSLSLGVVGLAMLGIAMAAPLMRLLGTSFARAVPRALMLLGPVALLAGLVLFSLPHRLDSPSDAPLRFVGVGLACLTVLALTTVPLYACLRREPGQARVIYGASLMGAAVGAPLVFGILHLGGDTPAFVALMAGGVVPVFLLVPGKRERAMGLAAMVVCAMTGLVAFDAANAAAHPDSIHMQSDALSRIDVTRFGGDRYGFRTAGINAGTSTIRGDVRDDHAGLMSHISAAPFRARPERVLVLGSGAGKNVVQAIAAGAEEVVAVEINPMIPELMRERLPVERDPYRDPSVRLVVGEARHEVERLIAERPSSFDLVYVPMVTLYGSSGQAFTQTYLMTREALGRYTRLLSQEGIVAVYFAGPPATRARVVAAMVAALGDVGVEEPADHVAVLIDERDPREGWESQGLGFAVLARPSGPIDTAAIVDGLAHVRPDQVAPHLLRARAQRALTDDLPFLYNDVEDPSFILSLWGWSVSFVRALCLAGGLLLLVLLLLGVRGAPRDLRAQRAGALAGFVTMGVGYAMFQTFVLQRLGFLVGHPTLATVLVLCLALLASGLGARYCQRVESRLLRGVVTVLLVAIMAGFALVPTALLGTWSANDAVRFTIAITVSVAPFTIMGTYFPLTLQRLGSADEGAIGWAWALNGVGAVFGSILVVYGSMLLGFSMLGLLAALLYAGLGLWQSWWAGVSEKRTSGHVAFALGLGAVILGTLTTLELG